MMFRFIPLLAAALPLIAMFGALWIGIASEALPACFPPIDGAISISATGRKPPGSFLFRAIMLPYALLLAFLWYLSVLWLRSLDADLRRATTNAILISGLVGSLALIVYVTFLGTKEPLYEFMRRVGIYFGYLGTALAQLFVALALARISKVLHDERLRKAARLLVAVCVVTFCLGILNSVLKMILEDADASENRIEWIASILMQSYFFVLFLAWRSSDMTTLVRVRKPGVG
jgi:uncharacterized membrane protein YidH (DUF202 family)